MKSLSYRFWNAIFLYNSLAHFMFTPIMGYYPGGASCYLSGTIKGKCYLKGDSVTVKGLSVPKG